MSRLETDEQYLPCMLGCTKHSKQLCESEEENLADGWEEEVGRLAECFEQPERWPL